MVHTPFKGLGFSFSVFEWLGNTKRGSTECPECFSWCLKRLSSSTGSRRALIWGISLSV